MMSLGRYFFGIVTFSVAVNLIGMLYPSDKSGVRRALDICMSLCLLCAVIAPIGGMIADAKKDISFDGIGFEIPEVNVEATGALLKALEKGSENEIEEKLYRLLSEDFGEDNIEIDVSVNANEDGVTIECVSVYLYGSGLLIDPHDMSRAVAKYTGADCRIIEGRR
jgi:hypothetical protein